MTTDVNLWGCNSRHRALREGLNAVLLLTCRFELDARTAQEMDGMVGTSQVCIDHTRNLQSVDSKSLLNTDKRQKPTKAVLLAHFERRQHMTF